MTVAATRRHWVRRTGKVASAILCLVACALLLHVVWRTVPQLLRSQELPPLAVMESLAAFLLAVGAIVVSFFTDEA